MERKSDAVRRLVSSCDYKAALKIAKDFRLGISKEDADDMRRGYECMTSPRFYQSIGIDTEAAIGKAVDAIQRLYGEKAPAQKN
jgi:hypothetical protein